MSLRDMRYVWVGGSVATAVLVLLVLVLEFIDQGF